MKNYKFALVGCGRISGKHIDAINAIENTNITAVCDIDIEKAKKLQKRSGMLNIIPITMIC